MTEVQNILNLSPVLRPGGTSSKAPLMNRRDLYALTRSLYLGTRDEQKLIEGKKQAKSRLLRSKEDASHATRGTHRPPLPLELIRWIFRLAECHVQFPTPPWRIIGHYNSHLEYYDRHTLAHGFDHNGSSPRSQIASRGHAMPTCEPLFFSRVVTKERLRRTSGLRLETVSCGYPRIGGAPQEGWWTCFRIALYERTPIFTSQDGSIDREKTKADRDSYESQIRRLSYVDQTTPDLPTSFETVFTIPKAHDDSETEDENLLGIVFRLRHLETGSGKTVPLSWISHYNGPHPSSTPEQHIEGEYFGPSHALWEHLKEGDQIVVFACAAEGWACEVEKAELKVWDVFEPINLAILQGLRRSGYDASLKPQNDAENHSVRVPGESASEV